MRKLFEISPNRYKFYIGDGITLTDNIKIKKINDYIRRSLDGIIDTTISYNCLLIETEYRIDSEALESEILTFSEQLDKLCKDDKIDIVYIPVCYDGEFAPDMEVVSNHCKIDIDNIISIHTSRFYYVYFIGFLPGFPYLAGLDSRLFTPRRENPRTFVPSGSVGIGGSQTGIYPIDSPGGWQIIGRTPVKIFDYTAEKTFMFDSGMGIKFFSIDIDSYYKILEDHSYKPERDKLSLSEIFQYDQGS